MTIDDTTECVALIVSTYPTLVPNNTMIDVWHRLIGDLDANLAQRAVLRVLATQTGSWWPAPGTIRAEAVRLMGDGWPDAEAALGEVLDAVRQWGYMRPAEALAQLSPPVADMVRHLGWQAVCEADPDVLRGQWVRLYEAARANRGREVLLPRPLQIGTGTVSAPFALGDILKGVLGHGS